MTTRRGEQIEAEWQSVEDILRPLVAAILDACQSAERRNQRREFIEEEP